MTKNTKSRRITATLAGPLLAAGIFLGSAVLGAPANAQPATGSSCSGMAMTDGQSGPNPSGLTRAGQVGSALNQSASDGAMTVDCAPASHG